MSTIASNEFQAFTERVERSVQRICTLDDEEARNAGLEVLQSVMDLHGAVVARLVQVLESSEAGRTSLAKLGSDPLVCGMLVLYGAHPVAVGERVARAIESARAQLRKHGGSVELLDVSASSVRVKIESSGHGCGSSIDALSETVEQAIMEAAPEIAEVVVEGAPAIAVGFVSLGSIQPASLQTEIMQPENEEEDYEESAA